MPLLEIERLAVSFTRYRSRWGKEKVQVLHDVEFSVDAGEVVAVIGASGSGKSLLAHALLGILPENFSASGTIRYRGEPLDAERLKQMRGKEIALVPQSVRFLDPLMRVGAQVRLSVRGDDPYAAQREVFHRYGLAPETENMYPFQLSGGMARRVLVSTATVSGARVIIADEPTPGLQAEDVREALRHFREHADAGCAVLVITHDIESVLTIADRVVVLYAGTTVEIAPAADFTGDGSRLRHPYSRALWQALPQNGFTPIPGTQPQPGKWSSGCLFAPRCDQASPECTFSRPELRTVRAGQVRCIHAHSEDDERGISIDEAASDGI